MEKNAQSSSSLFLVYFEPDVLNLGSRNGVQKRFGDLGSNLNTLQNKNLILFLHIFIFGKIVATVSLDAQT